ncbi:glycoside-pentoside-hexuronide (GPH):cation symporter [Vibrio aphrogenes]|uniref:glycoside-pentoside-hexuronide (GPH):cation symporter n=1 Tax=Vibrio aphrogenes TaxID=1891186 RepID=UPI0013E0C6DA|nr:glycoside-pentoside-hexuronide (GPH):cation symporter [Vibrio aphrogenes]
MKNEANGNLPLSMKLSYGMAGFGKDLSGSLVMLYGMFYFTDILGISPAFVGTLLLVARFWDAVNDPLMGILLDKTKTRFGRIRPWLFGGALCNTILIIAIFHAHLLEGPWLYAYISITYILWGMAYTAAEIPFWCIIPNAAKTDKQKASLLIWPRSMVSTAWLVMGSFFFVGVDYFGQGSQEKGFTTLATVAAIFSLLSVMTLIFNYKEKSSKEQATDKKHPQSLKEFWNVLKSNDQLLVIFIALCFFWNLVNTVLYFAIYYFTYVVESKELYTTFMLVAGITEVVAVVLFPILAKKFSREILIKVTYILPIIGIALLAYSSFFALHNIWLIAIGSILVRTGHGFMLVLVMMMLGDCIDYGQFKTGKRTEGVVMATYPMQFKIGNTVMGFIMGLLLSFSGYIPNVAQSPETIGYMRFLFLVFPIIMVAISYFIYTRFYKLKGDYLIKMKAKLELQNNKIEIEEETEPKEILVTN